MLHGWGDAGSTFQFVVDALKNDWFVIAPDWRGFGETQGRAESYWFPDYLADLDALLKIYSPDKATNLLGHSMGGNIAGLYAGIFSDRVANLINVEGFGLADRDPEDAPANYRHWIEKGRKGAAYRSYDSYVSWHNEYSAEIRTCSLTERNSWQPSGQLRATLGQRQSKLTPRISCPIRSCIDAAKRRPAGVR